MNQCDLLLNIKNDNLIFFQVILSIKIELLNDITIFKSTIVDLNVFRFLNKVQILSQRRLNSNEQFFFIHNVNAESFDLLVK